MTITARRMRRQRVARTQAAPPATAPLKEGEFTRGGFRIRRWPNLPDGMIALLLDSGDHIIVAEKWADEVRLERNPFVRGGA